MTPKPTVHPWNVAPPRGASMDRHYEGLPDPSRKAYATCDLSFNPQGARFHFWPGDEVQDVLPGDVLAACAADGRVTYTEPSADELLAGLTRRRDDLTRVDSWAAGRQLVEVDRRIGELEEREGRDA